MCIERGGNRNQGADAPARIIFVSRRKHFQRIRDNLDLHRRLAARVAVDLHVDWFIGLDPHGVSGA